LTADRIPDSYLIQFGREDPRQDGTLFAINADRFPVADLRPRWAQAMDANRDGDISREEFTGSQSQFEQLDNNGNGFVELAEVGDGA
jgi:hypothetical protein